jgi:hypothetical protein
VSAAVSDSPSAARAPRRRGRAGRWLLALVVLVVLLAGAAVAAEFLARHLVADGVRTLLVSEFDVPADTEIDVRTEGLVVPQLVAGRLDELDVSSPDLRIGTLSGAVDVHVSDVPIRGDAAAGPGAGDIALDEAQLRDLLGLIDGFPAETVGIDAPAVTVSTDVSLFGATVPVGVGLLPGAADGSLTLTPDTFQVGDVDLTADALRQQFGSVADAVLREWDICIADQLPRALTLDAIEVVGDRVHASFTIDGAVVVDADLQQPGTCS